MTSIGDGNPSASAAGRSPKRFSTGTARPARRDRAIRRTVAVAGSSCRRGGEIRDLTLQTLGMRQIRYGTDVVMRADEDEVVGLVRNARMAATSVLPASWPVRNESKLMTMSVSALSRMPG